MASSSSVKPLNVRIDEKLFERFDKYCRAKGQAKTVALSRILDAYLSEYEKDSQSKSDK